MGPKLSSETIFNYLFWGGWTNASKKLCENGPKMVSPKQCNHLLHLAPHVFQICNFLCLWCETMPKMAFEQEGRNPNHGAFRGVWIHADGITSRSLAPKFHNRMSIFAGFFKDPSRLVASSSTSWVAMVVTLVVATRKQKQQHWWWQQLVVFCCYCCFVQRSRGSRNSNSNIYIYAVELKTGPRFPFL